MNEFFIDLYCLQNKEYSEFPCISQLAKLIYVFKEFLQTM